MRPIKNTKFDAAIRSSGLTLTALAQKCEIHVNTLTNILRGGGTCSDRIARKICDAIGKDRADVGI